MVNWEYMQDKDNPELLDMKSVEAIMNAIQFEALVKLPSMWRIEAQLLLIAAEQIFNSYDAAHKRILERDLAEPIGKPSSRILVGEEEDDFWKSNLLPISLLLKGFAVENLLKGIIYSQDSNRLQEDDKNLYLDKAITHHRLNELYLISGLAKNRDTIDPETKEILEVLEQIIIWQGRYPVPLNLEQYRQKKRISKNLENPEKINDLCNRLFGVLNMIPHLPTHL